MSSAVAKPDSSMRIGREQVGDQQGVDDEAGPVLGPDDVLAELLGGERRGPGPVSLAGEQRGHHLHQVQHGHRVEEVDAERPTPAAAVAMASFMIGIEEVFDARMAVGSSTTRSRV